MNKDKKEAKTQTKEEILQEIIKAECELYQFLTAPINVQVTKRKNLAKLVEAKAELYTKYMVAD